jgi:hypothetical protein
VSKVGGEPWGCCAWPIIPWYSGPRDMVHCHGAEARYWKTICEAVSDELHLESIAERLCRQSDSWSGIGEETRDAPDPRRQRKRSALSWHLTGLASLSLAEVTMALFLQKLVVAFHTFLWPSYQVSGRTWWKHIAPLTHPFHNTTEGQTRLHCRSTHSQLSQAAIRSSGMWRQEMLPSNLHGCHFDSISSFSV